MNRQYKELKRMLPLLIGFLLVLLSLSVVCVPRSHGAEPEISTVHLIHPVLVAHDNRVVEVDRIEIMMVNAKRFNHEVTFIKVFPTAVKRFGKALLIPVSNVKMITFGSTTILGHGVEE